MLILLESNLTVMLIFNQVKNRWPNLIGASLTAPRAEHSQVPRAKSQNRPLCLGQTGHPSFSRNPVGCRHIKQNRQNDIADLGQTAVWPNIC